jgi:hypothetical protein
MLFPLSPSLHAITMIAWSGGRAVGDYLIYNNATNNARITATSTLLGRSN